jgi:pyruvate/2-oxoglutarate/acetoin dehydrogenase E1 component/TPP-dependent pyruvate/acetoin dehydrogenase alpha subunit
LIGRREVLTGKAKFGIFGDGKELAQVAWARFTRPGDWRAGYYRDQTWVFATGLGTVQQFFAQLYAHPDAAHDPFSAGRQMNAHFATWLLDEQGQWLDQTARPNIAADLSPTASQMPKLLGLAQASKLYRNLPELAQAAQGFSRQGDEVVYGTIGDASTSEGLFWETVNAAGVLQIPLVINVWDDGYGISVPIRYQTTKASISQALSGMHPTKKLPGVRIETVKGWDYPALLAAYAELSEYARTEHKPVLLHVQEVTQPQGHSTSGSHERYKTPERLAWEQEYDGLNQMRQWMLREGLATEAELDQIEAETKREVNDAKKAAWNAYRQSVEAEIRTLRDLISTAADAGSGAADRLRTLEAQLASTLEPIRREMYDTLHAALRATRHDAPAIRQPLLDFKAQQDALNRQRFNSHLHSQSDQAAANMPVIAPHYGPDAKTVDGREVLQACFDAAFARDPRVLAFGEDLGFLGDVNQAFAGLQAKYGEARVSDTGIREATIIGQGIGLALRGLRPIAEIQYLDYILYALQLLSDELATLHYRTAGRQKAPLIIRTRGHRLEGVWHSGSPMGGIINLVRGIHVCVPRNMTQAAGMYNTLLQADEPAIVVEVLNGYRLKEPLPDNIGTYTVPLGQPEVLRQGADLTVVTYGPSCRLALEAADILAAEMGIDIEVIDIQTLLPFDTQHTIVERLRNTNRLVVLDEDVPGGASAFILQQIMETQGGYRWLDSAPHTLAAQPHRPAYASDGDYFSKPQVADLVNLVTDILLEAEPERG